MSSTSSHMDNFRYARVNMIESQIRAGGVTNSQVIAAMADLPRESFVPSEQGLLAYAEVDAPLPVSDGGVRYLLSPPLLARLVDAAGIHEGDLVLDIGCASGYSTAILAQLVGMGTVVGLEKDEALAEQATRMLARLDLDNTVIIVDDLAQGYPAQGPYNVILLNGASARPPDELAELFASQLSVGGRFVGVFDDGGDIKGQAWRFTKKGDQKEGQIVRSVLFDARAPILPGFEAKPSEFRFPGISKKPQQEEISAKSEGSSPPEEGATENWPQENEKKTLEVSSPKPMPSSGESKEAGGLPEETIPTGSPSSTNGASDAKPIRDALRASASADSSAQEVKSAQSGSKEKAPSGESSAAQLRLSAASALKLPREEKESSAKSLDPQAAASSPSESKHAPVWRRVKTEQTSDAESEKASETKEAVKRATWPPKSEASSEDK